MVEGICKSSAVPWASYVGAKDALALNGLTYQHAR